MTTYIITTRAVIAYEIEADSVEQAREYLKEGDNNFYEITNYEIITEREE